MINQKLLALRFQEHTGCSETKAQQATQQYITLCGHQILRHLNKDAGSQYYIDQTYLQNTLRDIIVKGKRYYLWQTFQSFKERIFSVITTGSNLTERLSMAEINYKMEDILMASGTPEELCAEIYRPYADAIMRDEVDYATIDIKSLGNYIKSNIAVDRDDPANASQIADLDRNLKHAHRIMMIAMANDGRLPQIISPSSFGRKYYQGPNLQNVPKIVRHAALGYCHEYDIESSVFAWKLSWFRDICRQADEKIAMPATLEYLDHKPAIRRRLAKLVFDTESEWAIDIVKSFITAIGFGAPARSAGYRADNRYQKPALATIIYPTQRLDLALNDTWVIEFIAEQKRMNEAIVGYGQIFGQEPTWRTIPELVDKANRLRPNSVVAYLYQQHERKMLDWAEEHCEPYNVVLTVHDCIYTSQSVNLTEFRSGIKGFGEFFKLEHKAHTAWAWEDEVDPLDPFYDPREAIVAERIKRASKKQHQTDVYVGVDESVYVFEDDPFYDEEQND